MEGGRAEGAGCGAGADTEKDPGEDADAPDNRVDDRVMQQSKRGTENLFILSGVCVSILKLDKLCFKFLYWTNMEPILDNPAWSALNSIHRSFALGTERAKRYRREVVRFVACAMEAPPVGPESVAAEINPWIADGESFYMIGEIPALPADWVIEHELPCHQMMAPAESTLNGAQGLPPITGAGRSFAEITLLSETDKEEMFALINGVQPGYYEMDTRLMGAYYGIREEGKLVSMAGERMRMEGFSELSAVCTHPAYTGRKYAQQLIAHICRRHYVMGVRTFLHVAKTNERAVRLYEHLGFTHRREIVFRRIRKNGL
jgi:ribosomal protein S18 acetylase RimI-like enzyme